MRIVSILALILLTAACSSKDEGAKSNSATAAKPVAAKPVAQKPAAAPAAAKSEYKPEELWSTVSGMSRMDLMEKFSDGVTVTGTVKGLKDDPMGEYGIELDAGDGHIVELRFGDFGKAAKAKKFKAGDAVAASKCQITTPQENHMAVVQCELK